MLTLPTFVNNFMGIFRKNNYQIYLVGGGVRHLLLNEPVKNWDFTTDAKPKEILELFDNAFYNNDFGTVGIPIKHEEETLIFEVTTMRKESGYSDKRRPDNLSWTNKIQYDLNRRDFTINAMAFDGKNIIDEYDGLSDLKKGIIRAVGDPNIRFNEDALRLMRAIRIATILGFTIENKTRESLIQNSHLIKHISWERIRDEFFKILSSNHPADGILFLKNTNILSYILPELDKSFSIPQKSPKRHHIYDVGTHSVMALKHCTSKDVIVRFATLIHDVGKVEAFKKDPETQLITFYNHEITGWKLAEKIADRFKLSKDQKHKLVTLVRYHQFSATELQTDKAVRRFIRNVGKELVNDMLDLRTADRIGSGSKPTSWRYELFKKRIIEVQKQPFSINDLKIDGDDIMKLLNLKPSPKVGDILKDLLDKVINKKVKNSKSSLLKEVEKVKLT